MTAAAWARVLEAATGRRSAFLASLPGRFALHLDGIHGPSHWLRVLENGLGLAAATGADSEVVRWFAVLHDVCRESDHHDPAHGPRAAAFAREHRREIELDDEAFALLLDAVASHTSGRAGHPVPTVHTCFDADRLDLPRAGITPDPRRLCTDAARVELARRAILAAR